MARPTKYTDDILTKVKEYIKTTGREQTELPTVEGLAVYLGISRDTIYEWIKPAHKYDEFSDTIKEIEERQKAQLINDGMYGGKEVNSTMAIFLLKANHGMIETEKRILEAGEGVNIKLDIRKHGDRIHETSKL